MYFFSQNHLSKAGRDEEDLLGEGFDLSYSELSQGQYHERNSSNATAWNRLVKNRCEPHTPGSGESDSTSKFFRSKSSSPAFPSSLFDPFNMEVTI